MNETQREVIVFGSLNIDRIWNVFQFPNYGQTIIANSTRQEYGGKGANQAVAAARLGAQVALIGCVGSDHEGVEYRNRLKLEGIDVEGVFPVSGEKTGSAHVYVDSKGENLIVVDPAANQKIADSEAVSYLRTRLSKDSFLMIQLEIPLDVVLEVIRIANEIKVPVFLNPSPVMRTFPWGRYAVDTLILNQHEFFDYIGTSLNVWMKDSHHKQNAFLQKMKISNLIVTQGSSPTICLQESGHFFVPTFPIIPKDTVGAGDTFAGALAAFRAQGEHWNQAIWKANVAAALSTQAAGAQEGMPNLERISEMMNQNEGSRFFNEKSIVL